jgi:TATA-box binding protein (TBP) (component of TFIID and TFIIIB)
MRFVKRTSKKLNRKSNYDIVNVVCTAKIDNMENIAKLCKPIEKMNSFHFKVPNVFAIIIYKNGKLVCLGNKSVQACKDNIAYFCTLAKCKALYLRVTNFVAKSNIGCKIDLGSTWLKLIENGYNGYYESEIFPGITLRLKNNICIKMFASGKLYGTGFKNAIDINGVFDRLFYSIVFLK